MSALTHEHGRDDEEHRDHERVDDIHTLVGLARYVERVRGVCERDTGMLTTRMNEWDRRFSAHLETTDEIKKDIREMRGGIGTIREHQQIIGGQTRQTAETVEWMKKLPWIVSRHILLSFVSLGTLVSMGWLLVKFLHGHPSMRP